MDMDLLLSVSSGLGRMEEMEDGSYAYVASEDCLACLKDLQRFLRKDDPETRAAFFKLGQFNVAKSDLVPIIVTYAHDTDLVYNALKVVTFLTMPVEADSPDMGRQVEHMQAVREAFLVQDALKVVVTLVAEPLGRHPDMSERDSLTVQLVVTFVRNLLAVADVRRGTASGKGDHKTRLRQELLGRLLDENVLELLLIVAQHTDEAPFKSEAPLLLEVFHLIFDGISASELLTVEAVDQSLGGRSNKPLGSGSRGPSLAAAVQKDDREKSQLAQASMMRHARFGATLVHRTAQGVNMGRSRVAEAPAVPRRVARNAKHHVQEVQAKRASGTLIPRLRAYAEQVLEAAYDVLMDNVRSALEPGLGISRLAKEDFLRFLQLTAFFTAYVRGKQEIAVKQNLRVDHEKRKQVAAAAANATAAAANTSEQGGTSGAEAAAVGAAADEDSPFACISATMGYDTFHLVQMLWLGVIDQPINSTEKDWELQHSTLALLKEMLFTLDLAVDCGNSADRAAADRLQRKLLHDDLRESGLLPVLARLVKAFNWRHQSRRHAADLVASLHVVLRMLHHLNSSERGGFLVKRAVRGGGGPRKKKAAAEDADNPDADGMPPTEASNEGLEATVDGDEQDVAERHDPFAEEEEDEEEQERRVKDVAYNLKERIRQELAFPAVIHFYTWLLQGYASNGRHLNHYLLAFLQRIAHPSDGLDLEPMLYQLSVLRVFSRIQQDVAFHKDPAARELLPFVQRTTRNMFARMLPAPPSESPPPNARASPTADENEKDVNGMAAPATVEDQEEVEQVDGGDSDERRSSEDLQREVKDRTKQAKIMEQCASLMFIELLFWKNSKDAEALREDYHWREDGHRGRSIGERRAMREAFGDADDGGDSDDGNRRASKFSPEKVLKLTALFEEHGSGVNWLDGCVEGFEGEYSRTTIAKELKALGLKRGRLTENQTIKLRELFEKHGGKPGYLDWISGDLGGSWKSAQVGRQLKALGLKRGVLTANQVERLKELFEEHHGKRQCYQLIADGLQNGLSKGQVASQLRKLGLKSGKAGGGPRRSSSTQSGGSDAGASDSGSDAVSGSDKDPESENSDGDSIAGSESDGDAARTGSVQPVVLKEQKRPKAAQAAKSRRRKSNDNESQERAAFKKLKSINLDSDEEESSGASEPISSHSPESGSPANASTAPDAADTDSEKRGNSINAASRQQASNMAVARRGSDGGNAGKRPSAALAEQDIKRRKSAPNDGTAAGKHPTPGERAAAMALLQARRQQKRRSLPSRANAAAEDGSEVEDAGGAVKENIPPAAREPASAGRPPPTKRRLLKKAAQLEALPPLADASLADLEDF